MCAAFSAAGAAVTLYTRAHDDMLSAAELQRHYDVPPNFAVVQRPFPRGPRPGDLFQARIAWQTHRPEPWVCYSRGRDLTAPVVALLRGAARAVVEVHGRPLTTRERLMLGWIARHPRGYLVALSDVLRDIYVAELGYPAEHIIVAPDGVDLRRFTPMLTRQAARAQLGLSQDTALVVYIGGLYSGRGLEALCRAMAAQNAQLLIVGGSSAAQIVEWQTRTQALGLPAGQIIFTGYRPPAQVPADLFAADVLAMPYGTRTLTPAGEETAAWMSPLKMFEYLAAGRPIVATDLPALRTVLTHDHDALLLSPDDDSGLAAAIQTLLTDHTRANRLAANARQTATRHTWQARAEHILAAIE